MCSCVTMLCFVCACTFGIYIYICVLAEARGQYLVPCSIPLPYSFETMFLTEHSTGIAKYLICIPLNL